MIKTGILSTASIVPRVIEGIRSCEDFEICALASRDKEKADVLLEKNKNAAKERYEYYKNLLNK